MDIIFSIFFTLFSYFFAILTVYVIYITFQNLKYKKNIIVKEHIF